VDEVPLLEVPIVGAPVVGGGVGALVVVPLVGEAPDAGEVFAGAAESAFAGAPPLDPGSISEIICWKVASSMGRSDFPSQVEPSGRWFCTVETDART
jgi:hypothetical protein